MGTIAITKPHVMKMRDASKAIDEIEGYFSHIPLTITRPEIPIQTNVEMALRASFKIVAGYKERFQIERLWKPRANVRNKWKFGYLKPISRTSPDDTDTAEYHHIGYALLVKDSGTTSGYNIEISYNNGNQWHALEYATIQSGTVPLPDNYYHVCVAKLEAMLLELRGNAWPEFNDRLGTTQTHSIVDQVLKMIWEDAVEVQKNVYWIPETVYEWETFRQDIKHFCTVLDFPPEKNPESVSALFESLRKDVEDNIRTAKREARDEFQGWKGRHALENMTKADKYREMFGGLKEFQELVEELKDEAKPLAYEHVVREEEDVFSDITID